MISTHSVIFCDASYYQIKFVEKCPNLIRGYSSFAKNISATFLKIVCVNTSDFGIHIILIHAGSAPIYSITGNSCQYGEFGMLRVSTGTTRQHVCTGSPVISCINAKTPRLIKRDNSLFSNICQHPRNQCPNRHIFFPCGSTFQGILFRFFS